MSTLFETGPEAMKITALAPWYGSKRTLAPVIVKELGRHKSYWEPFCGSLAVLLEKPEASMEVVNDLHQDLINLARVLASDNAMELYALASRSLMHTELFSESKDRIFSQQPQIATSAADVQSVHVTRALDFLIMSWQGRNGQAGTKASNQTVARRFTHNGGSGGLRWRSAVDSIPAWHERLRAVQILNMDAFEMLERIGDQAGSAIYVDPPYLEKSAKYIHDFAAADHERLARLLRRFKSARVVVSYYDDPRLVSLYPGWKRIDVAITKGLVNQGKRDREGEIVKAPEVLIINGESYA